MTCVFRIHRAALFEEAYYPITSVSLLEGMRNWPTEGLAYLDGICHSEIILSTAGEVDHPT